MIKKIFSKEEVLISCSSLNNLNFSSKKEKVSKKFFISEKEATIVIGNIKECIKLESDRIAGLVLKNNKKEKISELILDVLLNRRYRRGSRESNNPNQILRKSNKKIKNKKPIELNISLFPCKIPNILKTDGELPDLAELLSIARLKEISLSVKRIYPLGLKFIVLLDGLRFEEICYFNKNRIETYQNKISDFLKFIDPECDIEFQDYIKLLRSSLSKETLNILNENKKIFLKDYFKRMGNTINLNNPQKKLNDLIKLKDADVKKVVELFKSLLYSINFKELNGRSEEFIESVYENPLNMEVKSKKIREARKKLIKKTWTCCLKYVSEISAGRAIKPTELIYPEAIKCDMHMIPERYTFYSIDRSSTLTAFHGTGCINGDGIMGVKFRYQLIKAGYVPVYVKKSIKFPYMNQAFFYVPGKIKNKNMLLELINNSKIRK